MGCFESYMELREEVEKIKKERGRDAAQRASDVIPEVMAEAL